MMEVTVEEEAQAVLLGGMEGAQYITIQSADGESLGKGISLYALNGELLSEGMVVDMINSDVGAEYSTTAQYYEAEDLLPPDMTEEDRKLAAALVAVQIQQQQKQQLHGDSGLRDVVELQTLETVNMYTTDPIGDSNLDVYPSLPGYKHEEEINFKYEDEPEESSEEAIIPPAGAKRSLLPHKKRIPKKLKQPGKKVNSKKQSKVNNQESSSKPQQTPTANSANSANQLLPTFKCELCSSKFTSQLKFFEHLKSHYEPLKPVVKSQNLSLTSASQVEEEFSENEDLMEGIRGVVEETGARIDAETDNPLLETNDFNWPSAAEIQNLTDIARKANTLTQDAMHQNSNVNIPEASPTKKERKRSQKMREEHTCKECMRYFNHKNSLIYHMRSHSGDRPHQCEVCGKRFFAASALKVHKRLHSGDKPYKCEDCGRTFRQWGDLKYHSTSLHSELRQFQCEFCGKDFARKYSLVVHQRIHTGEKNYCCDFCTKTFRASSYLQNHRRIHTGEKPHPCTICAKPFRVRSDMKRHMQTHSRPNNSDRKPTSKPGATATATTTATATAPIKPKPEVDQKPPIIPSKVQKTVRDLVQELKLEVEPESIGRYEPVDLVAPEENNESILPDENTGNLDYVQPTSQEQPVSADLEPTIRNSDNFHYLFM